ncbi:PREDICTED: uncharacterized protein LOC104753532 [Camelina sativa]|uniref:Uncharacterized protein LOC104753532 n=1 Tax=Camelina sativa TaxID=90675 RepID=A0ABM0WPA6_CAMSA|nr:PREDICTED: uncharacterized protein LOC104753532 [Camelina sativa]
MYVIDLPRQFFMVRFELEDEYLTALTGGPWRAFGSYLMVLAWTSEFDTLVDEIVTTLGWIRLSNIPVSFYHKALLMIIVKGLGKPVKVDLTTLNFERGRFARICVEVNLKRLLKGTIMINGERYFVSYEGLKNICSLCGMFGHVVHSCPRKSVVQPVEKPQQIVETSLSTSGENRGDEGFTPVRMQNRRSTPPPGMVTFAAGEARGNLVNDWGRTQINADPVNITVANKFGSLSDLPVISGDIDQMIKFETRRGVQGKPQTGNGRMNKG